MTTDRSYRKALGPRGRVLPSSQRCAGTQFDPRVVEAAIRVVGREAAPEPRALLAARAAVAAAAASAAAEESRARAIPVPLAASVRGASPTIGPRPTPAHTARPGTSRSCARRSSRAPSRSRSGGTTPSRSAGRDDLARVDAAAPRSR